VAERVDKTIETVLKDYGLWQTSMRWRAVDLWREIVGDKIAAHATAIGVIKDCLVVSAPSPSWRQELHLLKKNLADRLNKRLGGQYISDIRFGSGRGWSEAEQAANAGAVDLETRAAWPGRGVLTSMPVSPQEAREIEQATAGLADRRLGQASRSLALTLIRRRALLQEKGGSPCPLCGALYSGGICPACAAEMRSARRAKATAILARLPWLDGEGLAGIDPELGEQDYAASRDFLLAVWSQEAHRTVAKRARSSDVALRLLAANISMLVTHTPPEKLTDEIIVASVKPRLAQRLHLLDKD